MRTFRRYLLSYLCTLLLPVLILSVVIYDVVVSYCGAQLLEQNLSSLKQLSLSVSMQRDQLDAYAVQTTNRSEFFYRNQQNPGDFYDIQSILSRWIAGNAFIDDICYYNPKLGKVYASDAIYSIESFARLRTHGLSCEEIQQIVSSNTFNCWLSSGENLFYLTSARVSPRERNWLFCKVSNPTLRAMIENTKLYTQAGTYICAEDGGLLYATENTHADVASYLTLQETKGVARIDDQSMIYTRLGEDDLIFLSIVPEAVANKSLAQIWKLVYIALFVILVLGAVIIAWVMKLNYEPIHRLENDVLQSDLLTERSADALQNVRRALQMMQNNHTLAMNKTIILDKERMILRLLMGSYSTAEQFNADGKQASMHLGADSWYIVNALLADAAAAQEDALPHAISAVRQMYADRDDLLYLEIPENNQLLLIVSGQPCPQESAILLRAICECGLQADVMLSPVCDSPKALSRIWQDMSVRHPNQQTERIYPKEIYDSLLNAIEFGESERIRFAIEMLIAGIRQLSSISRIRTVCTDVLALARGKLPAQEADRMLAQVSLLTIEEKPQAEQLLRRLSGLLCDQLEQAPQSDSAALIQQIEAYLQSHYCEAEFSVQKAASQFNLSISNLGHYFKSHTGVTVSDYVESLRLNLAQKLLRETDKNISDISVQVGYQQPASFMRAFKKVLGVSPTNWRNTQRSA